MNLATNNSPPAPLGYCPRCNYLLLTTGRCPECGREVSLSQIRPSPRGFAIRLWMMRLLGIAIAVALFCAGLWIFETGQVYRVVSNATLIESYPSSARQCEEIARRIRSGAISKSEIEELIAKSITVDVRVANPFSSNSRIAFECSIEAEAGSLIYLGGRPPVMLLEGKIDGIARNDWIPSSRGATGWNGTTGDQQILVEFDTLQHPTKQSHELDLTLRFLPRAFDPTLDAALPPGITSGFDLHKKLKIHVE